MAGITEQEYDADTEAFIRLMARVSSLEQAIKEIQELFGCRKKEPAVG